MKFTAEQKKHLIDKCRAKSYPQRRSQEPREPKPHEMDIQPEATRILDAALKHKDAPC